MKIPLLKVAFSAPWKVASSYLADCLSVASEKPGSPSERVRMKVLVSGTEISIGLMHCFSSRGCFSPAPGYTCQCLKAFLVLSAWEGGRLGTIGTAWLEAGECCSRSHNAQGATPSANGAEVEKP